MRQKERREAHPDNDPADCDQRESSSPMSLYSSETIVVDREADGSYTLRIDVPERVRLLERSGKGVLRRWLCAVAVD